MNTSWELIFSRELDGHRLLCRWYIPTARCQKYRAWEHDGNVSVEDGNGEKGYSVWDENHMIWGAAAVMLPSKWRCRLQQVHNILKKSKWGFAPPVNQINTRGHTQQTCT